MYVFIRELIKLIVLWEGILKGAFHRTETHMKTKEPVIAGIYPFAEGFGYALAEWNSTLIDYGIIQIRPVSNTKCLKRIRTILEQTRPDILVLRDESAKGFRGSKRTEALLTDIRRIAQNAGVGVVNYSRKDIRLAFSEYDVFTKRGIAQKICQWLPTLEEYYPPKKKDWKSEHINIGLFDAMSLIYTYLHANG